MTNYQNIEDIDSYLKLFENNEEKALQHITDIRKFEIELYWKRTTFFWTILTAITTGYIILYSNITPSNPNTLKIVFALGCLGLIFSIGWYFVNRGSKFWQVNWEKHLYCIEDLIIGPLYKTTIDKDYYRKRFWKLASPYPFSVTKINHVLNIIVILFWGGLLVDFTYTYLSCIPWCTSGFFNFYFFTGLITFIGVVSLFNYTHTGLGSYFGYKDSRKVIRAVFEKRGIK